MNGEVHTTQDRHHSVYVYTYRKGGGIKTKLKQDDLLTHKGHKVKGTRWTLLMSFESAFTQRTLDTKYEQSTVYRSKQTKF